MKIKSILSALLLMVSSLASAQYLNVKLEDGTVRSFKTTPNMKVSFGDKAGAEVMESEQTVTVNGHTVTVKLAKNVASHEIFTEVYVDGNTVKIEVCSRCGKIPVCDITGNVTCTKANTGNIYDFTLSGIVSDIAVTIGLHDGVFTISKDEGKTTKLIYFSKGNLWADNSNALHFESNQWEFVASYDKSHVSHFTWSSTVSNAAGTNYSGDFLFCDENHKVSVDGSSEIYYALSMEEWNYLLNTRQMKNVNFRYTLNITYGGKKGLVLYPDDYDGGALSGTVTVLPDGVVFIPSAGRRNGGDILDTDDGYYASSTVSGTNGYRVFFNSSSIKYNSFTSRYAGSAVHLVTDVK